MDKIARGFFALAFSLTCTAPALAGIADSPLPVLSAGATTIHLYSVPGVISTGGLGTYSPNCRMTASQVRDYGLVLGPAGCAMAMWQYDLGYMSDAGNQQAFKDVAAKLATLPRKPCRRT